MVSGVVPLNRTFQTENLDLPMICCLVDETSHMLDDTLLPLANWVLELIDDCHSLEEAGMQLAQANIIPFKANQPSHLLQN